VKLRRHPERDVRRAWAKFRELAPVLTSRGASLKVKVKVFKCVTVCGSEIWSIRSKDMSRLGRAEKLNE